MKHILIVDDQVVIRWVVRVALGEHFVVDEADNVGAAWGRIKRQRPDGMVLDVRMPGPTDGFQLCERIKRDPDLASINVVLVTACDDDDAQERGRLAGANGYFVKPVSPLALANHFRAALQNADRNLTEQTPATRKVS